jgi:hypothetical protein
MWVWAARLPTCKPVDKIVRPIFIDLYNFYLRGLILRFFVHLAGLRVLQSAGPSRLVALWRVLEGIFFGRKAVADVFRP